MMTSDVAVSLRPALAEDRFRIRRWLADPEIEAWWGNAASAEAEINLAMGSTAAVCRIVVTEGVPIGYAQAAEVGLWAAERPAELAPGMWQVACFVTPATDRGGSLVPRVLSQLTEEVFATTLRAGGLPLAADLARRTARPVLADAEGPPEVAAARSPSCPAATSSLETVSAPSPAISSSMVRTRLNRSPCPESQSPASREPMASRVNAACAPASWLRAWATARRS
jgi:hypothetical protein